MERLDKLLAHTGKWSRKEASLLIRQGRVSVYGETITDKERKYLIDTTEIQVDGIRMVVEEFQYIMLHKPAGYLSATQDNYQATVMELLPQSMQRLGLFPVGRLDKDSEGLLLLTNDGSLGHRLLMPKNHVDKVYYVEVEGFLTPEDEKAFREGLVLEDGMACMPAELERLTPFSRGRVTLHEGKFHQVKRMLASRGKPVTYLKRLSMGSLVLDKGLNVGEWRFLTRNEQEKLRGI